MLFVKNVTNNPSLVSRLALNGKYHTIIRTSLNVSVIYSLSHKKEIRCQRSAVRVSSVNASINMIRYYVIFTMLQYKLGCTPLPVSLKYLGLRYCVGSAMNSVLLDKSPWKRYRVKSW